MEDVNKFALFAHLIGFALGFGAVMLVDIIGLLWALRLQKKHQLLSVASVAQKIIWLAIGILIISGSFLLPDNLSVRTKVKLAAVMLLVINGVVLAYLDKLAARADTEDFWKLPRKLQIASIASISFSQLLWWTAIMIGFLNSTSD